MATDKKTIGITTDNLIPLQELMQHGHFGAELDAAKFAMAHAIKIGILPGRTEGADTKWNVGSVDPDGHLRAMISAFFPNEADPYRVMEYLMNKGLSDLAGSNEDSPDVYGMLFGI